MLRALFVAALVLVGVRYTLKGPFYGLLFYLWIAYFRPEDWLWIDYFSALNLSLIVGVVVLLGTLLSGERLRFGVGQGLMLLFLAQSTLSVILSPASTYATQYWQDFAKSTVICLLITTLVNTERRLRLTLLVIAASLGMEATKQGWVQLIVNPGSENANHLAILGDNNGVAVGMLMLVTVVLALAETARSRWAQNAGRFAAIGILYRGIITYSRGGFVAGGAVLLHQLVFSKRRFRLMVIVGVAAVLILPVLPDPFWARMRTIGETSRDLSSGDESIQGRLHFWRVAMIMANDRPFVGVGHNAYNLMYAEYDFLPGAYKGLRSVHSMWFGVVSELGYPGLILLLTLMLASVRQCRKVRSMARGRADMLPLATLATALEAGLVAASVGGAFVIFQYNEMLWHWFALSIATGQIARERAALRPVPGSATAPPLRRRPVRGLKPAAPAAFSFD
jgi:probable O-glycosylation ligase (exosortase A-associated)